MTAPDMPPSEEWALAEIISTVTDLWDEPLDEVHDVPQIVNAILAAGWRPTAEPDHIDEYGDEDPPHGHPDHECYCTDGEVSS